MRFKCMYLCVSQNANKTITVKKVFICTKETKKIAKVRIRAETRSHSDNTVLSRFRQKPFVILRRDHTVVILMDRVSA